MTSTTDILQPLPFEKWPILKNKTKYNWPNFAYYHNWIENAIQWKKKDKNVGIEIYCPYGDYEEGTFLGISHFGVYWVLILTLNPNNEIINKMLTETSVIDWSQQVNLVSIHGSIAPNVLSAVEKLKHLKNIAPCEIMAFTYYFKSAEECTKVETRIPDECYIKPLSASNVPLIVSVYPHRNDKYPEKSSEYINTLLEFNGGIGLYLKENDSLVCWIIQSNWYGIGTLQTVEKHKRKGYAKVIVNVFAKMLGERGISPTLFIVNGNTASETLFTNLGWRPISPISWVFYDKQEVVTPSN